MATPLAYLQPIIGYATGRLLAGESVDYIVEKIRLNPDWSFLTPEDIPGVIGFAENNAASTNTLRLFGTQGTLGSTLGPTVEPGDRVGVRVLITGTDASGGEVEASIVVNVPSTWTRDQVLVTAQALYEEEHRNDAPNSPPNFPEYGPPELISVFEGGLQGGHELA